MPKVHLFLLIAVLFISGCNKKDNYHKILDYNEFFSAIRDKYSQIKSIDQNKIDDFIRTTHRDLSTDYPILYDWWLQDGNNIDWLKDNFISQLNIRLNSHNIEPFNSNDSLQLNLKMKEYINSCTKRRENRLAEFIKDGITPIVFTKFRQLTPSFFAYTEGLSDARNECNFFAGGELSSFVMDGIWANEKLLLKDSLSVFRDPDVSLDGRKVLFSWKKSAKNDDFHLYEINLEDKSLRQLTHGVGYADIEPLYLPNGNILFNSTRAGTSVDCWFTEVSNMFICDENGKYTRQVGFDQVHTVSPALLDDGRIVYTRWDYNDRGQVWTQPLLQMNQDGTAQTEYYGMNSWFPTTVAHVRQIPGTRKVMATLMGHHNPQHGKIGIIDPEAGRDENEGVMLVAPLRKPQNDRIDSWGQYEDQFQYPFPLNEKEFIVSYSPLGYYVAHPIKFSIYWMNVDGERELLISDKNISCNQPVKCTPRENVFNRVSTVDYTKDFGVYYMQNVYKGKAVNGVAPGEIKKLRIVEIEFRAASVGFTSGEGIGGGAAQATPVGIGNAAWDIKHILGEVDVYKDGSAFFKVPSRKPLYFQALNEKGEVVQTMRSWSTLQPGEVQSCVGCHEHKNSVPLAEHQLSIAMSEGMQDIKKDTIVGGKGFSYIENIQPIWDKNCISCHDGIKNKFSLKGELKIYEKVSKRKYSDSYINLTAARPAGNNSDNVPLRGESVNKNITWISSLSEPTVLPPYSAGSAKSDLIRRLRNGHGNVKLSEEDMYKVMAWIDLLVPFVGNYKEANNWSQDDMDYYDYYYNKREKARDDDRENIKEYIESLSLSAGK